MKWETVVLSKAKTKAQKKSCVKNESKNVKKVNKRSSVGCVGVHDGKSI